MPLQTLLGSASKRIRCLWRIEQARDRMKFLATIQLATSIHADCYALISLDRDFEKSSEILVLG